MLALLGRHFLQAQAAFREQEANLCVVTPAFASSTGLCICQILLTIKTSLTSGEFSRQQTAGGVGANSPPAFYAQVRGLPAQMHIRLWTFTEGF